MYFEIELVACTQKVHRRRYMKSSLGMIREIRDLSFAMVFVLTIAGTSGSLPNQYVSQCMF